MSALADAIRAGIAAHGLFVVLGDEPLVATWGKTVESAEDAVDDLTDELPELDGTWTMIPVITSDGLLFLVVGNDPETVWSRNCELMQSVWMAADAETRPELVAGNEELREFIMEHETGTFAPFVPPTAN